eukprot:gene3044-5054_t
MEKKQEQEQGKIEIDGIPEELKVMFNDILKEVEESGFRKKWLFSSLFEIILGSLYKKMKTKYENNKNRDQDGRIFILRKTDNTYIYKEHFIFGYGKEDNCLDYDELCKKQDDFLDQMQKILKSKDGKY